VITLDAFRLPFLRVAGVVDGDMAGVSLLAFFHFFFVTLLLLLYHLQ
jgi:hypothetical protein